MRNFHIGSSGTRDRKLDLTSMFLTVGVLRHFPTWAISLYGISDWTQF